MQDLAQESDHPKSQLVLDAVEKYVRRRRRAKKARVELPAYPVKVIGSLRRADIYEERLDHIFRAG